MGAFLFGQAENTKRIAVASRTGSWGNAQNYASVTCATSRTRHKIRRTCTNLVIGYSGFAYMGVFAVPSELGMGNNWEIRASLRLISSGTTEIATIPLYFNGLRLALVPNGRILYSDPVPVYLEEGQEFFIYTFANRLASAAYTCPSGQAGLLAANVSYWPRENGTRVDVANSGWELGVGMQFSTSTGIDPFTLDLADAAYASLVPTNQGCTSPTIILGDGLVSAAQKSVAFIGDSILAGAGDRNSARYTYSGLGYGYYYASGQLPIVQTSLGGDGAQYKVDNYAYNFANRYGLVEKCDIAYIALGTNDIVSTRTAEQVETDLVELGTQLKQRGIKKLVLATVLPRTTTTDGWLTVANQTVTTTNSFNTKRATLNAWILTIPAPFDAVVDLRSAVEDIATGKFLAAANTTACTTAAGSTTTVINIASPTLVASAHVGQQLAFGALSSQITANTTNTITVSPAFSGSPGTGVTVTISDPMTGDGTHPSQYAHYQLGLALIAANKFT